MLERGEKEAKDVCVIWNGSDAAEWNPPFPCGITNERCRDYESSSPDQSNTSSQKCKDNAETSGELFICNFMNRDKLEINI